MSPSKHSSSTASSNTHHTLERKWKCLNTDLNDFVDHITEACQDPDTQEIEELCERKGQLLELGKTLNILVEESDSASFYPKILVLRSWMN